jgi:hypothetical protein
MGVRVGMDMAIVFRIMLMVMTVVVAMSAVTVVILR